MYADKIFVITLSLYVGRLGFSKSCVYERLRNAQISWTTFVHLCIFASQHSFFMFSRMAIWFCPIIQLSLLLELFMASEGGLHLPHWGKGGGELEVNSSITFLDLVLVVCWSQGWSSLHGESSCPLQLLLRAMRRCISWLCWSQAPFNRLPTAWDRDDGLSRRKFCWAGCWCDRVSTFRSGEQTCWDDLEGPWTSPFAKRFSPLFSCCVPYPEITMCGWEDVSIQWHVPLVMLQVVFSRMYLTVANLSCGALFLSFVLKLVQYLLVCCIASFHSFFIL